MLADQRQAMAASCESYDRGNDWEAARLATTVFTLVHDGGGIVSLLTQLGIRGVLRFVSSGSVIADNIVADIPLVMHRVEATPNGVVGKTVPLLGDIPPGREARLQFSRWWEAHVYQDEPFVLSRKRLVFALRHQDGGGHVGGLTDEAYIRLKTQQIGFVTAPNKPNQPLFALTATMRQIAWEVTKTLDEYGPIQ